MGFVLGRIEAAVTFEWQATRFEVSDIGQIHFDSDARFRIGPSN
jgi:hypothetical protein